MSYKSTILTPCWSDFRSTLRSPCPQFATKPSGMTRNHQHHQDHQHKWPKFDHSWTSPGVSDWPPACAGHGKSSEFLKENHPWQQVKKQNSCSSTPEGCSCNGGQRSCNPEFEGMNILTLAHMTRSVGILFWLVRACPEGNPNMLQVMPCCSQFAPNFFVGLAKRIITKGAISCPMQFPPQIWSEHPNSNTIPTQFPKKYQTSWKPVLLKHIKTFPKIREKNAFAHFASSSLHHEVESSAVCGVHLSKNN